VTKENEIFIEKTEDRVNEKGIQLVNLGERIDRIGFGNLSIIQLPKDFCYGIDAVILGDFAAKLVLGKGLKQKSQVKRLMDLGTGTGIIPLILSHKTEIPEIYGLEVQEDSVDRGQRTMELNCLDDRVKILRGDVSNFLNTDIKGMKGTFDMVVSNPPYVAFASGIKNANAPKHIARQETTASLDDFVKAGAELLRDKGHFLMVHRPSRLAELVFSMKTQGIEPKTLRFVSPMEDKPPNILLIHGIKNGGSELEVMSPLIVYQSGSVYSEEIQNIYER
jgi:tRNA1Val (adenine37-N6)-methyltransferase